MKTDNELVVSLAIKEQLKNVHITNKVFIKYKWFESNKKRDLDNIAFAKKFIQDALVKKNILENDGWKNISGFQDRFYIDKDNPRIEIELIEVDEDDE